MAQLVTVGLSIFGGLFVYVCGQLLSKTFLDPLFRGHNVVNQKPGSDRLRYVS